MDAPITNTGHLDDARIDRLVDGELHEAERHELLTSLDGQPDGWRRCALAFLQAQCWRSELEAFVGETVAPPTWVSVPAATEAKRHPSRPLKPSSRKLAGRLATALAMAASFFFALWLGRIIQDAAEVATVPAPGPAEIAQSAPVLETREPVPSPQQRPVSPRGPWQMVTLSANGPDGKGVDTINLPACERHGLDRHWPDTLPSAMPPDVLKALERTGYRVRQHRELMPVEMQDGRRLIVPVEEVEVQYVGQPPL